MGTWDERIFAEEANVDFLEELANLDNEGIVEGVRDACVLAASGAGSDIEEANGHAAATIAAIWAGAPFSAGAIVEDYPFIRELIGEGDEDLNEKATEVLESVDTEEDLEAYLEALA